MLDRIMPYVVRYSNVIATVTGIDIEVVDQSLIRIAGTGMYAAGVGASIQHAGEVYRHVLSERKAIFMENPREHALCLACASRPVCRETLSLCTPIVYDDKVLGVIGLVCFTQTERDRVLAQKQVFQDFVLLMADEISREVQQEQKASQTRKWLDMLMQVVDGNSRGIMVLNTQGQVSYINDTAGQQLHLPEDLPLNELHLDKTGDAFSGMEEFTVTVGEVPIIIIGHVTQLDTTDAAFSQVLLFDSLPQYTRMLSQGASGEGVGELGSIIGESPSIRNLKNRVRQIATTPSTVLITGESGTGKEMFARAIHAESDRRDKPFIAINCGAIPDALLESELFGYVRGAFTGANPSGRMGKFELAHEGVLFLDEIGSMPLYLQVKLLRVLQDKRIIRLGSNRLVDVDVRIIAATNDNLQELINQRMFRDDLYYRLNVIPLEIPPLRSRQQDIGDLARYFLERYCQRFGKRSLHFSSAVIEALKSYQWPGNVREFENTVEYLVNIAPNGGPVYPDMLPEKIRKGSHGCVPLMQASIKTKEAGNGAGVSVVPLAVLEQQAIRHAIAKFGNTSAGKKLAAEALGIGIATLYRKLKDPEDD